MAWAEDLVSRIALSAPAAEGRIAWWERGRGWGNSPAVLINLDDDGRLYTHDGANALAMPDIEVDVFGPSGSVVEALAAAVRAGFENDGDIVGETAFGFGTVRSGRTIGPEDLPDGTRAFRRRMLVKLSVEAA
jgi:hypothetical protein